MRDRRVHARRFKIDKKRNPAGFHERGGSVKILTCGGDPRPGVWAYVPDVRPAAGRSPAPCLPSKVGRSLKEQGYLKPAKTGGGLCGGETLSRDIHSGTSSEGES